MDDQAPTGTNDGCVAKTGEGLVKVAIVLTVSRPTDPVHEHLAPVQVASFPIRDHSLVCPVVPAVPTQLPQLGRDDAGEGTNGRPYDGVSVGPSICAGTGQAMQTTLETNQ